MRQSQLFSDLHPTLTEEHFDQRAKGQKAQRDLLQSILLRHGIQISSAIKCEMALTQCTYEEACVRFVQSCDAIACTFHYCEMGEETENMQRDAA